jgi:hypothetical protein
MSYVILRLLTSLCFHISSVWKLVMRKEISYPGTALRLRMMKLSALCIKKAVNFFTRMASMSSLCLMPRENLTEFTELSMRTLSFSERQIL